MNTTEAWAVILILIMNTLIAIIVFIISFRHKDRRRNKLLMLSWFIFIVPLLGSLYILLAKYFTFIKRKDHIDMGDISFSQGREKEVLPPDFQTEMNYVPIQDAMRVSDIPSLRQLLLSVLRNNAETTISSIAMAINSEDTETSHYAASYISDALSESRRTVQDMVEEMENNPEDPEMNLLALEYIHKILSFKIMNDIEQKSHIYIMDHVAENLFANNLWYMSETHYLWMVDWLLYARDFDMADKWINRAREYRPHTLETYKAHLHLYSERKMPEEFLNCLDELKQSDIPVDEEILNLFRLYDKKEK